MLCSFNYLTIYQSNHPTHKTPTHLFHSFIIPSLKGKLHAAQENFLTTTIINSISTFDKVIEKPEFYDVISLGNDTGLALCDGQIIYDKTVRSISSKIYSTSKVNKTV